MAHVTLESIKVARQRIEPHIHKTPIATCSTMDQLANRKLFFKCENFQKVGAFKIRGATNAVFSLPEQDAKHGVVTHSSGNHAQALALAAQMRNIPAYIVMPHTAPLVKRNAVELTYGAKVHLCEPSIASREATCKNVQDDTGATLVHPYNDELVINGQGTVMLELFEQLEGNIDAVLVPVSGGGLISGVAACAHHLSQSSSNKKIRVFGVEPESAADALESKRTGQIQHHKVKPNTIADGLLGELGSLTFPFVDKMVEDIFVVQEEQIISAMKLVFERMKMVIEPSSATVVAAALYNDKFKQLTGVERVALLITGGNVDLDNLPWVKK